jgi:hypothetical protein
MAEYLSTRGALVRPSGGFVAALYAVFSMADLVLSLGALSLGIPEGNPVLAGFARHGLFVPAKVCFTVIAAVLMVLLYPRPRMRSLIWSGLLVMVMVDVYHLWNLRDLLLR